MDSRAIGCTQNSAKIAWLFHIFNRYEKKRIFSRFVRDILERLSPGLKYRDQTVGALGKRAIVAKLEKLAVPA